MSFNLPTSISSIFTKLANDVKGLISKSNPFKNKSLTKAILTAFAGRIWDVYKQIEAFIDEMFDDTSSEFYLVREASDYGMEKTPATVATGYISVVGDEGKTIPKDAEFSIDSKVYIVDSDTDITEKTPAVTLAYDAGVVVATFAADQGLGTGQEINISGASETSLNGDFEISVLTAKTVQYSADVAGSGSDSGTATYNNALVPVTSNGYGDEYNLNSGEVLTIGSSIAGVDNEAVVIYDGITGAVDIEDTEDLRSRLQYRKKNPASFFNESQVRSKFLELSWVKKVFIKRCTPEVGQAKIYLVKENNEIPSESEIDDAKDFFESYLPINTDYDLIDVDAPDALAVPFVFSALDPDTSTMREAIEANLAALFLERADVDVDMLEAVYNGVIANTIDPDTLLRVNSYTLDSPSGDIEPDTDELPTYDGTTWSI